jgi:hypothetical protein
VPHWHIIGYGMSELYAKETDNPDESGWGFEFTFRPARDVHDTEPPMWAASLLQNLARYVVSTGNWFEPGHHMNANGPIRQDDPTTMTALAFIEDPELGSIVTPHGRLRFLQVVGLTGEEYAAARQRDTIGVLELLIERQPLLITDLGRPPMTDDAAVRAAIDAGRGRDGSSTGSLLIAGFEWAVEQDTVRMRFKQITAASAAQAVRDRLHHGRDLHLVGDNTTLLLRPAEAYAVSRADNGTLEVDLPPEAVTVLPDILSHHPGPVAGTSRLIVETTNE